MKFFTLPKIFAGVLAVVGVFGAIVITAYWRWTPGSRKSLPAYPDNAIWLSNDVWCKPNPLKPEKITILFESLRENHISMVFPRLGQVQENGKITAYDDAQLKRFLDYSAKFDMKVIPYVHGILNDPDCMEEESWRENFISSVEKFLNEHPRLAGVQINFEPWPYDKKGYLSLLEELRPAIKYKILSVAVYSPNTKRQPYSNPRWPAGYYHFIAERCDLMVPMLFNTSIPLEKCYTAEMTGWTNQFSGIGLHRNCKMILGIPAGEGIGRSEHSFRVENLSSALQGISASPDCRQLSGVAIYCQENMTHAKWRIWRNFIR